MVEMEEAERRTELKSGDYIQLIRDISTNLPQGCVIDLTSDYTTRQSGNWIGKYVGTAHSSFSLYGALVWCPLWDGMNSDKFFTDFSKGTSCSSHYVKILTRLEIAEILENTSAKLKYCSKKYVEIVNEFKNYPDRDTFIASQIVKKISEVMDKNKGKLTSKDLAPVIKDLHL